MGREVVLPSFRRCAGVTRVASSAMTLAAMKAL